MYSGDMFRHLWSNDGRAICRWVWSETVNMLQDMLYIDTASKGPYSVLPVYLHLDAFQASAAQSTRTVPKRAARRRQTLRYFFLASWVLGIRADVGMS